MKLKDLNKENIFSTPDGYFESFQDRISDRVNETEIKKIKPFEIRNLYKYAAAVLLVLAAVFTTIQILEKPLDAEKMLSEVSSDALIDYLIESDLSEDELLANLDLSLIEYTDADFQDYLFNSESIDEKSLDEIIDEYEIELIYL